METTVYQLATRASSEARRAGNGRAAKEGKNRGKEIAVEKELAVAGEAEKEGLEEAEEVCEEVGGGGEAIHL